MENDLFEELLRERPAPTSDAQDDDDLGRRAASGANRLRGESLARLLDAAVLVVHAIGNLTSVAEDVLADQRDRLRAEQPPSEPDAVRPPTASYDRPSNSDRAEQIDLTY